MGLFKQTDAVDALTDILERERAAVLDGRFDVLERLMVEKERLVGAVAQAGSSTGSLARLKAALDRNGMLLAAMRAGVAAAHKRVKVLRDGPAPLATYDASGRKTVMPQAAIPLGTRV